jgi:hypothetical protein
LFYWKVPLGGSAKHERFAVFGFMVRQNVDSAAFNARPLQRLPVVDIRFNASGEKTLHMFGVEAVRMNPRLNADESKSPETGAAQEVNWWVVGGAAAAAVLVIRSDRSSSNDAAPKRGVGN